MDQHQRVLRGQRAAELLTDEVYAEAFAKARDAYIEESLTAPTVDVREMARACALALEQVRHQLTVIVQDGQFAAKALERTR